MKLDIDLIKGSQYYLKYRYAHLKYIIFPDDPTKLCWDILVVMALLYVCIMVPYDISFKDDNQEETTI